MRGSRLVGAEERRERAERILDAACGLLLSHGYRRVTVDDVARAANVGKGTLYLHWRTREALFRALLLRESASLLIGLTGHVRADHAAALPWRLMRILFLEVLNRPLLRGVFLADQETLAGLIEDDAARRVAQHEVTPEARYLDLLVKHRVLRDDLGQESLSYLFGTIVRGFFSAESSALGGPGVELRAELLGDTILRTLGASSGLDDEVTHALAADVIDLFTDTVRINRVELQRAYT